MEENKKETLELYRLTNCMWAELQIAPFNFSCLLRNLNFKDSKSTIINCNKCLNFKDTNAEIDGGYLG
jgi:hypothetical protein